MHPLAAQMTILQRSEAMSGKRILYIEDNPENRMLVRRVLTAEGYTLLEAANGASGLRLAEEDSPDLILMDINLPEMDGYELTTRIKLNPKLADVPVIAMTANVMHGDREKSLAAGCDGYIQKPIDIDLLPDQIAKFLSRQNHESH
jgi:two-component system cell cycle response regulator DivK